jgi:carbonic anhydrase
MTDVDDLVQRNREFASTWFDADLTINPRGHLMVVGCVDPRVDPTRVLGLAHGEAAVIRNVGGRITPATLRTMGMLGKVGRARRDGSRPQPWNVVVLHHTDCGMRDLAGYPDLLIEYFEIPAAGLGSRAVADPVGSVQVDVGVLLDVLRGSEFFVSGLVYDVVTGLVDVVVGPTAVPTDERDGSDRESDA